MEILLKDGRKLAYEEYGDTKGKPVFLFHGLHSSRLEGTIVANKMEDNTVRLIAIDRAGMGQSTFQENRTLFNTVDDVLTLAEHLHIDTFSVIGTSSGAKYALACAYKIPHKLQGVYCLSSGVPTEFVNEDMSKVNRIALKFLQRFPSFIKPIFWLSYARLSQDNKHVDAFLGNIVMPLDKLDKDFLFKNKEIKEQFLLQCRESYTQGVQGNAYDIRFDILENGWGFDVKDIAFKFIAFYHGTKDLGCPLSMTREFVKEIDCAVLHEVDGEGHLTTIFSVLDDVLEEIK